MGPLEILLDLLLDCRRGNADRGLGQVSQIRAPAVSEFEAVDAHAVVQVQVDAALSERLQDRVDESLNLRDRRVDLRTPLVDAGALAIGLPVVAHHGVTLTPDGLRFGLESIDEGSRVLGEHLANRVRRVAVQVDERPERALRRLKRPVHGAAAVVLLVVGGEGLRHVVLKGPLGVGRDRRRHELRARAARLHGQAASEELDVVTQISGTEDNAQHGPDAARGIVVEGAAGDGNDAVIVGFEARLGDAGAEVVKRRGLVGQYEAGHVDAVAAHRDADGPGDEFARAALVVQPAVFLLAALGRTLRGGEGEPRVIGEGDSREWNVDLHLVREAVDLGPVAVIFRLQASRFIGSLTAAAVPVVKGILEQRVPAAQVGRPGEVPRGLTGVPVGAENLDQPLDSRRIKGLGLDPGEILHLANLEHDGWSDCRFKL